ncbi:hypothetical protein [Chishuiella sp.]|uniref:hypothetical protein n=1 Tax=Chishuiella sp. TaxID=1969467 RepID=UPI0028B06429|nr:hypothetical protein [Chishuiella sp.]
MSIKCPKCQSEQITSHKNGFGISKAILGALTFGGIGIVAGSIGKNKVNNHCMNCGYKWKPQLTNKIDAEKYQDKTVINNNNTEISVSNEIPVFSKEDYNKEIFKRTGKSASDPKFAKLGKSKKRREN